jgi:oxygen-independent coproporphyrinogen-3 oxidase
VVRAVAVARGAGVARVSLDLIFSVPGQDEAALDADLAAALALGPDHVSVYCLTFEPGTAFDAARAAGALRPQHEGRQARLYARARRTLRAAGFEHYEVSNFARPGARCAHNRVYWRNHPYLGLGNGAASHLHGERRTNLRDPAAYAGALLAGQDPLAEAERLPPERKARETAYLALRTSEGIVRRRFLRDCAVDPWALLREELARLEGLGLVRRDEERAWLTGRGVTLADAVGVEVL